MDRRDLGDFLRSRRERLPREHAGQPPHGGRRRTPGLRREDVALLAGMSVGYYERLEQARGARPSPEVLAAVGRALRLSEAELSHALVLAGHTPTAVPPFPQRVPADVQAMLDRLGPIPAYVTNARHDVLAWNRMATAVLMDFARLPEAERNIVRLSMHHGERLCADVPERAGGWATMTAGLLRHAVAHRPADKELQRLIRHATAGLPGFAECWTRQDLEAPATIRKRVTHATMGEIDLDLHTLQVPGTELRVVMLSAAPGSRAQAGLHALAAEVHDTDPSGARVE